MVEGGCGERGWGVEGSLPRLYYTGLGRLGPIQIRFFIGDVYISGQKEVGTVPPFKKEQVCAHLVGRRVTEPEPLIRAASKWRLRLHLLIN